MSTELQSLAEIAMQYGCRDFFSFEQISNFLQTGKYSAVPGVNIPFVAGFFQVADCVRPREIEQVRQCMDLTVKATPSPVTSASGYVLEPSSQTGIVQPSLSGNGLRVGDPSLVSFALNDAVVDLIQLQDNLNLQTISCPNLQSVAWFIWISNNLSLTTVDLGSASPGFGVGVYCFIADSWFLTTLDMSKLTSVCLLQIESNHALASMDFSGLTRMEYYAGNTAQIIIDNNKLASIRFPNLYSLGRYVAISITNEAYVTDIAFPLLDGAATILVQNTSATSASFGAMVVSYEQHYNNNLSLVQINLPALTDIYFGSFWVEYCDSLVQVWMPNLLRIHNGLLWAHHNPGLVAIRCESMTQAAGIKIEDNNCLSFIVLSALQELNYIVLNRNPQLPHIQLPATLMDSFDANDNDIMSYIRLPSCTRFTQGIRVSNNPLLNELSCPVLERINYSAYRVQRFLTIDNCAALSIVSFPSLLTNFPYPDFPGSIAANVVGDIKVTRCPSLTTIDFGNWIPSNVLGTYTLDFSWCGFHSSFINSILARCVASPDFNSGTINFSLNPFGPTGQGVIDKATLQARGVIVQTI